MATPNKKLPKTINPETNQETTLTVELIAKLEDYVSWGSTLSAAAGMAGIIPDILTEWLKKGQAFNTGLHGELYRRLAKAAATSELEFFNTIKKAAVGAPAEFAYNEEILPDGTKKRTIALDGEGKPIVLKKEVFPDYRAAQWHLERRNPKAFGNRDLNFNIFNMPNYDAALNGNQNQTIDVDNTATNVEKLPTEIDEKILKIALRRLERKKRDEDGA